MINETATYTLLQAHHTVAIPAIIILYITSVLINLGVGLTLVKQSKDKFVWIWFITTIFVGLVFLGLLLMPNVTQSISTFFGGLMK